MTRVHQEGCVCEGTFFGIVREREMLTEKSTTKFESQALFPLLWNKTSGEQVLQTAVVERGDSARA